MSRRLLALLLLLPVPAWAQYFPGRTSATLTEIEVDYTTCGLGLNGVAGRICKATITDAAVKATSKLLFTQSGNAPTGKSADENEMDTLTCRATPATGSFTLYCTSVDGMATGKYKVFYTVG